MHGEGKFEWLNSRGQQETTAAFVYPYQGLNVAKPCFETASRLDLRISSLDQSYSSLLPKEVEFIRFIGDISLKTYNFAIWISFLPDRLCEYGQLYTGNAVFVLTDDVISESDLLNEDFMRQLFAISYKLAEVDTEQKQKDGYVVSYWPSPNNVTVIGKTDQNSNYLKLAEGRAGRAEYIKNYVLEEYRVRLQEAARMEEEQRRVVEKEKPKQRFDEFVKEHDISAWPDPEQLARNPFSFEGQIVGMRTSFLAMIDRGAALFGNPNGVLFAVDSVPTTRFLGNEQVLLAARVKGLKDVQTTFGNRRTINLEYVAAHVCSDIQCTDLLSWNQ